MHRTLHHLAHAVATILTATLLLTGCAAGGGQQLPQDSAKAADDGFPVTISHVYGETTIAEKPARVAAVAWANAEVPLALGVMPVGMAAVTWGDDDDDGILPWVEEQIDTLGGPTPALYDETDGIDFEAVAATEPNVILAAYSGLSRSEYDTLSKIAPVVAYPDTAWGTSYEDMIRMDAAAIGLADEGDALIDRLHGQVDDALADYPELAEAKVLFSYLDPANLSTIGFYTDHDTRPGFLLDLGMPEPAVVKEESARTDAFSVTVSAEQADRFSDVDLFVTYGDDAQAMTARVQADPLLATIPAIKAGHIAVLGNDTPLAASANPSPLSIGWGIHDYFALLAQTLRG